MTDKTSTTIHRY